MDPYESFGLGQDMLFSSAGPGSDPQDGRLSRALADLQQDVSLLRARLSSIEEAVVLLNKANETDKMGARPDLFPSGDSSSIFGNISPGAAAVDPAPATSVRPSMPPSSGVVAGSGAAARLAARFNRLGSIAQGHRPPGRPSPAAQASNASTSGTQMAHKIKPVPFKNGITLVKDRRLINQIFLTKHLGPLFESIVEQERLRIRPLIDKEANARTTQNLIFEAFAANGHDLVRDGWNGFEFGFVTATDHKFMTLGCEGLPKQLLSAAELASEYHRRECFIVVISQQKSAFYDPIFYELGCVVSDDEAPDTELQDRSKAKGKPDFGNCLYCGNLFSMDLLSEHEESCFASHKSPMRPSRVKTESVAEEPEARLEPATAESVPAHLMHTPLPEDTPFACICGEPDSLERTMIGCDGSSCGVWRHRSCVDLDGARGKDWFCPKCRVEETPAAQSATGKQKRKNHVDHAATRSSSRLRATDNASKTAK